MKRKWTERSEKIRTKPKPKTKETIEDWSIEQLQEAENVPSYHCADQDYFRLIYIDVGELSFLLHKGGEDNEELTDFERLVVKEALEITKEWLNKEVLNAVESILTKHQKEILKLRLAGKTYTEIALKLDVNYTAVPNCLNGLPSRTKKTETMHGGVFKKLRKHLNKNWIFVKRLDSLRELYNNNIQLAKEIVDSEPT